MSKPISGLFQGTTGYNNWNTSIVWSYIVPTQEEYPGTSLPKSFNISTSHGPMWTHANATKHIYEAIISVKDNPRLKNTNPALYVQFIMYDYWKSLQKSVSGGIHYNKIIVSGNWEFIFSKARETGKNPVIKHARFTGLR